MVSDTGFDEVMHGVVTDPVTLREVVTDPAPLRAVLAVIDEALSATSDEQRTERGRLYGQRCVLLRILGDLEGALTAARLSLRHAGTDDARVTLAGIRLAVVHQWRGEYSAADGMYTQAVETAPPGYGSFAHLHAGKSRYEQGLPDEAIRHFEIAVRLRAHGPPDLRASAEEALRAGVRLKADMDLSEL